MELRYFLYDTMDNVKEVESELFISEKLDYVGEKYLDGLLRKLNEIGKMINGIISLVLRKNVR